MKKIFFVVIIFCEFNFVLFALGEFYSTARKFALGGTGISFLSGGESLTVNPGAVAFSEKTEFVFDYQKYFLGVPNVDIEGYLYPDISNIYFGIKSNFEEISFGLGLFQQGLSTEYSNQKMFLVLGSRTDILEPVEIGYGINISPQIVDYKIDNGIISFVSLDFGNVIKYENLSFATVVKNLGSTQNGLYSQDTLWKSYDIGLSYDFCFNDRMSLLTALETSVFMNYIIHKIGLEFWYNNLAFRTGINKDNFTSGFGLDLDFLWIDYGIMIYSQIPYTTHKITFTYRW